MRFNTSCRHADDPIGKGPFPAAIIISGRETRSGRNLFRPQALLQNRGLPHPTRLHRYEPMTGNRKNQRIYEEATTCDFARDAQAGINYLKQRRKQTPTWSYRQAKADKWHSCWELTPRTCHLLFLAGVGVDGLQI